MTRAGASATHRTPQHYWAADPGHAQVPIRPHEKEPEGDELKNVNARKPRRVTVVNPLGGIIALILGMALWLQKAIGVPGGRPTIAAAAGK